MIKGITRLNTQVLIYLWSEDSVRFDISSGIQLYFMYRVIYDLFSFFYFIDCHFFVCFLFSRSMQVKGVAHIPNTVYFSLHRRSIYTQSPLLIHIITVL